MTTHSKKTEQKWLDSGVSWAPKWTKSTVPRRRTTQFILRTAVLGSDADALLENIGENRQTRGNTKLLGKYQLFEAGGWKDGTPYGCRF